MKAFFLTILLLFACSRSSTLNRDGLEATLEDVTMDISHVDVVSWNVGLKKEAEVSQSFSFMIEMPQLKDDDVDYLLKQKNVDSWIIRLIQYRGSERLDLGTLMVPFQPKQITRAITSGPASHVFLKIFYAAAYASERFRSAKCPPFGHDKKITSVEVRGDNSSFTIPVGPAVNFGEKPQLIELTPSSFNGGHDLKGEYRLEIAPYNAKKKLVFGSFRPLPRWVEVETEERVTVDSCKGVRTESER